ncbi:unnamed protein product [Prorocentrum cordatum]|uniref:Uncharacterized protein n=1 Tax=Prorocentrum cordatum TaxID=2364126 RepID=A0ABN9S423_9DINO|nr:unnamed protein product [Polarella glacialis]
MTGDRSDRDAEAEEAMELLPEQPRRARLSRPANAAALLVALAAATAALLLLARGGPGQAGHSLVRLAAQEATAVNSLRPSADYCPASGQNCTALRCCAEAGFQCYKKNSAWASCRTNCTKNKSMPGDANKDPWDCEEFGARTPGPSGPVDEDYDWTTGGLRGQDCRVHKFCAGQDDYCYLKNKEWGSCMRECDPAAAGTKGWSCEKLY